MAGSAKCNRHQYGTLGEFPCKRMNSAHSSVCSAGFAVGSLMGLLGTIAEAHAGDNA